jgi:FKBP-type peptidyl-prolyl cis-trans isomerase
MSLLTLAVIALPALVVGAQQAPPPSAAPKPPSPGLEQKRPPAGAAKQSPSAAARQSPIATEKGKLSYAMGMDLGNQLKAQSVEIDAGVFARGLADALASRATLLTEAEARAVIGELQRGLAARQAADAKAAGEKNKAAGEAFRAENAAREGTVTLPSGVQYRILTAGSGKTPSVDDTVVSHYRLTLVDGKEIDSSYARGEPLTMPVKGGIKGWSEVLQLMPVGSKWQVVVPPQLGYGERGAGGTIGPNSTLVFEIELISIKSPQLR